MSVKKPKVVLFGTGVGGKNGHEHLKNTCQIVGFCDNDKKKQGIVFCGLPTYEPGALLTLEYDRIVVCSMYEGEILNQLISDLKIPREKIATLDSDVREYAPCNYNTVGCLICAALIFLATMFVFAWLARNEQ